MKKFIAILLSLILTLGLLACTSGSDEGSTGTKGGASSSQGSAEGSGTSGTDAAPGTQGGSQTAGGDDPSPVTGEFEVCGVRFRLDGDGEQSKLSYKYPKSFESNHSRTSGDQLSYRLDKDGSAVFYISVTLFDDPDPGVSGGYTDVKDATESISKNKDNRDFNTGDVEKNGINWTHLSYKAHYAMDDSNRAFSDYFFDGSEGLYAVRFTYVDEKDVNADFESAFLSAVAYSGTFPEPGTDTPVTEGSEGLKYYDEGEYYTVTGMGSFEGTELVIPSHYNGKTVGCVDEDAFYGENIVSLTIPATVMYIREDAFEECRKLETINFSEGLISIGDGSFGGCSALTGVTIPASVERISRSAFRECSALTEVTVLGKPTVANYAFADCTVLKKVTFSSESNLPYEIKPEAFSRCSALEKVVLSEGIETIEGFCFENCSGLKEVYLPLSLGEIGNSAFYNTGSFKIFYAGSEEDWAKIKIGNNNGQFGEIEYECKW